MSYLSTHLVSKRILVKFYASVTSLYRLVPRHEKTCLRSFQPGPTQTGIYNLKRWLEAWHFTYRKERDCSIYAMETEAMISCRVTDSEMFANLLPREFKVQANIENSFI